MLKAGDLARREDHRVRGSKAGEPDEIGGYHMYVFRGVFEEIIDLNDETYVPQNDLKL